MRKTVTDLALKEAAAGNRLARRSCAECLVAKLEVSERAVCRVPGRHRSAQRKAARTPDDGSTRALNRLAADIVALALRLTGGVPPSGRANSA